jgi:hypothetical protein
MKTAAIKEKLKTLKAKLPKRPKRDRQREQLSDNQVRAVIKELADYIDTISRTKVLMWRNFLAGTARGIGFTVGTAIVLTIVFKILQILVSWNIPFFQDVLIDIVTIVQDTVQKK